MTTLDDDLRAAFEAGIIDASAYKRLTGFLPSEKTP
jgi:hypothetical protein